MKTSRLLAAALLLSIALTSAFAAPRRGVKGQPAYNPGEWVLVANHLHSAPGGDSGWGVGVKHILKYCSDRNIEFAFMTDHNTIGHWFFEQFRPTGKTMPVGGMEWTSKAGHANLIGFQANTPEGVILPCGEKDQPPCASGEQQDYAGMVAEVHSRGGLVIINHPVLRGYKWPDATFGADAVEINRTWSDTSGKGARQWWHQRLLRGERITGFGGSDYHYFRPLSTGPDQQPVRCCGEGIGAQDSNPLSPDIDTPINLVRVPEKTTAAVMQAVKAGHVQVLRDLQSPRVFLGCDANDDGKFDDYMMGDKVRELPGKTLAFQVRVLGGKGQTLSVIDAQVGGATKVTSHRIDSDDFVLPLTRQATQAKDRFLRTEVDEKGLNVTNPLYY